MPEGTKCRGTTKRSEHIIGDVQPRSRKIKFELVKMNGRNVITHLDRAACAIAHSLITTVGCLTSIHPCWPPQFHFLALKELAKAKLPAYVALCPVEGSQLAPSSL